MRIEPYTDSELKRLKCFCGEPATIQWKVCADGLWRPICTKCDITLNGLVLDFVGDPEINEKMKKYREKMEIS